MKIDSNTLVKQSDKRNINRGYRGTRTLSLFSESLKYLLKSLEEGVSDLLRPREKKCFDQDRLRNSN